MNKKTVLAVALMAVATGSLAEGKHDPDKAGPCHEVKMACEKAGFVKGDAKEGYGLWKDCIDPIMKGTAQPANAKKPLPSVAPDVVAACKAKNPNFGQGTGKPKPAGSPEKK